jgi:alkylation response protein AidB-like acyl-CoA dehydrogenase
VFVTLFSVAAANSLGIARGAIESLVELAGRESSTSSTAALRDRPFVQAHLAEAEAILSAARAYVVEALGAFYGKRYATVPPTRAILSRSRGWRLCVPCTRRYARSTWCFMPPVRRDLHPESVGTTFPGYPLSLFSTTVRFARSMNPRAKY